MKYPFPNHFIFIVAPALKTTILLLFIIALIGVLWYKTMRSKRQVHSRPPAGVPQDNENLKKEIQQRMNDESALQQSYREIRQLVSHLQQVREAERAYTARDIHNGLGQQLTGIKMDLAWLTKRLNGQDQQITKKLAGTMELLDSSIQTVRRISAALRPGILDDLGLIEALEWQSHEFEKRSGVGTAFKSSIQHIPVEAATATAFFRICEESLSNIERHAFARNVFVSMEPKDDFIHLVVIDDGRGFDTAAAYGNKDAWGLTTIKEQVWMMGGTFEINSELGNGSTLTVSLPCSADTVH